MDIQTFFIFCATAVALAMFCHRAKGDANEEDFINLYDTLLTDYKSHVRPIANQSAAMNVNFTFGLISIEEIDDIKQHVNILAVVFLEWKDTNLVWSSSEYGDIDRLYLDQNKIWAPDVYVRHSPNNDAFLSLLPTRHTVFSTGHVVFESAGAIYTACGLEMTYFPFDTHACTISFAVLDSSAKDILLQSGEVFFTPNHIENEEWSANSIDIEEVIAGKQEFSTIEITIEVTRRPVYYIVNVILPTVVLGILSLLVFIVPAESGERLSYTLSILLSLSVYIPHIGGLIPTSSIHMPIVLRFLISLFLMNGMCVVMSTVIIAIRWSDVVDKNDVQKTILIFGMPITIKKRKEQNFASNDACLSQGAGVGYINGNENKAVKINKQPPSHPVVIGEYQQPNEEGSEQTLVKNGGNRAVTKCRGFNKIDPDVMAISDLVSRYSFLGLVLSFFIMTVLTFFQLYFQNF